MALTEVLDARDLKHSSTISQPFSALSATTAEKFYRAINVVVEEGDVLSPLEGNFPDCGGFSMSAYPDEQTATGPFLQHIKQSLQRNGVKVGCNGFDVKDVRNQDRMYDLRLPSGELLRGGLDGAVLPYGVSIESAGNQLRCGIEVKHSDVHNAAYKEQHGGLPAEGTESSVQFAGTTKGQALIEVLAAAVYAEYPEVLLLLSSYDENVILLFSEGRVTKWQRCSFNAAMAKMGSFLQSCSADRRYALEQDKAFKPETVEPVLQLRKKLRLTSSVIEQLDSVTAELDQGAKFNTALEFFLAARYSEHLQATDMLARSNHDRPCQSQGAT